VAAAQDLALNRTLLALADPTRRAILRRLARSPERVTDVAAPFQMSLNAVSKHIRVLEAAGLVKRTVSGREHLLRADAAPLAAASDWIAETTVFWESRLDALEARLVAEAAHAKARPKTRRRRR
jgi:DNA-binding transcriptional ArsR family regulator